MGVGALLGLVFGSIAAVFALMIVGAALLVESAGPDTTTPIAQSTREPDDEPTRPRYEPTRRPTREPIRRPTEDSGPDDLPEPVTLNRSLKRNTAYQAGMLPRLRCRAGNVNLRSHSQLKALILKTGGCMSRAWGQILTKQGIPFSPPGYAIAARKGRGACGDFPPRGSMVPYYCPRNATIYVSTSAVVNGVGNWLGYAEMLNWHGSIIVSMAHEYGHHVQNLTGMSASRYALLARTRSQSAELAVSRRYELQATCFAGLWMRSVASSYPISTQNRQRLFELRGRLGDDPSDPGGRTHGSPANNYRWFRQGWEKNKVYQCNTWVVSASVTS